MFLLCFEIEEDTICIFTVIDPRVDVVADTLGVQLFGHFSKIMMQPF